MADSFETIRRRGLLHLCGSIAGTGLVSLRSSRALAADHANASAIRSCILIFYYGGPSHLDTWDLKPAAPREVRGSFQPISTTVPGLQICEHLPQMARVMDKVAIIRSVHHNAHLHDSASIHALTGRPLDGPDRELFAPLPQFYPSYGSAFSWLKRDAGLAVPFASLPFVFRNVFPVPCQGGGFLGSRFDPLLIDVNPADHSYPVDSLQPRDGLSAGRFDGRRKLLETLQSAVSEERRSESDLDRFYQRAFELLTSDRMYRTLDITQEPDAVRARYGFDVAPQSHGEVNGGGGELAWARQMRGQNLLLARRLVEAGVPFVNVYDCRQQGQNWDAHVNCESQHRKYLLPQADQGLSALIEDLDDRGLLESTLVVAMGEFGRTPTINANAGRDHWPHCYSVILAGGGVRGGAVYGSSDRMGAYPDTDPVSPGDIAATIFWRFGLDHAAIIRDQTLRPHRLTSGEPIRALFS